MPLTYYLKQNTMLGANWLGVSEADMHTAKRAAQLGYGIDELPPVMQVPVIRVMKAWEATQN